MHLKIKYIIAIFILSSFGCKSELHEDKAPDSNVSSITMESIDPVYSGVGFNNLIRENKRLHPFIWNFMYQGAGIGIGDINNDGLPDLYFCGNMVSDKLYLNKGQFKFEDISIKSGIQDKLWSTGVNFIDINADGLLDIYVVKNFFLLQESVRTNKLFINNGDLSFTEQAAEYGLDDPGYGIQSYFFDADNDGDLDCYLVNQPLDQYAAALARPETRDTLPFSDKFYRNTNGRYADATEKIGLTNKAYGLSVILQDFDLDGWTDIYLCNDYSDGDRLLMNKGGLKFEDEIKSRTGHSSFYSMGSDVDDINNDGWPDFMTLDMAFKDHIRSKTNMESMRPDLFNQLITEGHQYQYAVNMLQVNNGSGFFSDIAHYAGVSHTDWSWSPLFVDLDMDSNVDILVSNGILRDLRNNDFLKAFRNSTGMRVNENNYMQIINSIPSTKVSNQIFQNHGALHFKDISKESGFDKPGFSSGMAWGDLDGDGDADIVINNTNAPASIFKNNTQNTHHYLKVRLSGPKANTQGLGAQLIICTGKERTIKTVQSARAYMSSSESTLIFGLAEKKMVDSLIIFWNDKEKSILHNVEADQLLTIDYYDQSIKVNRTKTRIQSAYLSEERIIEFTHTENEYNDYSSQVLLPHKISTNGPALAKADVNNDGNQDLWIGNSRGATTALFVQDNKGRMKKSTDDVFSKKLESDVLEAVFFDIENDGDQDLYVVHGGAEMGSGITDSADELFINNGAGRFSTTALPPIVRNDGQCVTTIDLNSDGYQDLFVGGRSTPGSYGLPGKSFFLLNNNGILEDQTQSICPEIQDYGMLTDALSGDYDMDGDEDILLVGEWLPVTLLINEGGHFIVKKILSEGHELSGWWWTASQADFDNDGDLDFLVGNLGENNKYKASSEKPLIMYAGDIDGNGDHDIVLAKKGEEKVLPVRGRECSSEEMPFISNKFASYRDYALAGVDDIYNETKINQSIKLEVNDFSHYYLENLGDLNFKAHRLPDICQIAPIKSFCIDDINQDGHLDFYFAGNHYPVEPETVRYDAGEIGICLGDGNGVFKTVPRTQLNAVKTGDVRDMIISLFGTDKYLIVANNNDRTQSFRILSKKEAQ